MSTDGLADSIQQDRGNTCTAVSHTWPLGNSSKTPAWLRDIDRRDMWLESRAPGSYREYRAYVPLTCNCESGGVQSVGKRELLGIQHSLTDPEQGDAYLSHE
jgi:hypothetical protein